ncbi:hypothetical protein PG985_009590 [Apiospora marii]|uniref:uncharacterized protein n=1 Tax=Apiospora marii TaxID=335849 RepID=UPI00312ECFD3
MSTFHCFERLAPELRQMIWDLALREETESRLVIVHRPTMRVMPHPSLKMTVMNACPESREYAQEHFYKVKLDVRTLVPATLSIPYELAAFVSKPAAQRPWYIGRDFMGIYSGDFGQWIQAEFRYYFWLFQLAPKFREDVAKLLRTPGPGMAVAGDARSGICKGTIFLSPEHDLFALGQTFHLRTGTRPNPWGIDLCERAFLRDQRHLDYAQAQDQFERIVLERPSPAPFTAWNPNTEFLARHIADKLPRSVRQKIRRLVNLHTNHTAGSPLRHIHEEQPMRARDWDLRAFKGAHQLYTAQMVAVPSDGSQGYQNLLEWKLVEDANGSVTFKCICDKGDGQNSQGNGPDEDDNDHAEED